MAGGFIQWSLVPCVHVQYFGFGAQGSPGHCEAQVALPKLSLVDRYIEAMVKDQSTCLVSGKTGHQAPPPRQTDLAVSALGVSAAGYLQ